MSDSARDAALSNADDGGAGGASAGTLPAPARSDAGARPSALAGLLDTLHAWRDERDGPAADASRPGDAAWPELPALQGFRALWAQLRSEDQLRRALAPAPADAGPLNSSTLVHRTLVLMREESPGYLRHFTAYVDALACLQDLQRQEPGAGPDAAGAAKKRAPGRARAPRGPARNA